MRVSNACNGTLPIQARNEKDFLAAQKVADKMCLVAKSYGIKMDLVADDEDSLWVQVGAVWDGKQRTELIDIYKESK